MSFEDRLTELGIELPDAPAAGGMASYVPAVRSGAQLWIAAGQPPGPDWGGGQIQWPGVHHRAGRGGGIDRRIRGIEHPGPGAAGGRRALDRVRQVWRAGGELKVVGVRERGAGRMDQAHRVVNGDART